MKEIVTIQVGDYANFVGSHFWNFQDELLGLAEDPEADSVFKNQDLNMDVLYRTGETQQGIPAYTPRLVSINLRGSLGSMSSRGTLYKEVAPTTSDIVTWTGGVSTQASEPHKKNLFLQRLYEEENLNMVREISGSNSSSQSEYQDKDVTDGLENGVQFWTDYSKVHFHPQSLYELNGVWADVQEFDNYGIGRDSFAWASQGEEISDRLRFFVEECDHIQGFQFVVDDSGGFSAVAAEFLENIVDEYPNTPVMLYAVQGSGSDASLQSRKRTILGELHDAISFSRLSSYCKLIVPVGLPSLNKSKASKFLHIEDGKHYHSSAVYAAALHSISLPFRMVPVGPTTDASSVSGAVDIHGLVQMVSCTLEVGLFLKILRDKGSTSVLQQFIQVHDLIAKKAWVTEVGFLDTIYGGQAVPTLGQFFKNLLLPQEVISLLIDEHLIQRTGYSTISVAETHHKQWDLGENFSDSCILETSCFKLWDPGGRLVTVCFWYLHLEDKVNFEGAGIDTIASEEGRIGNISMKEVETNFMGTTSTQAHTTIDVTELPTWQWGGSVRNIPLIWRESVIYSLLAFHSGLGWNWDFGWAWEQ